MQVNLERSKLKFELNGEFVTRTYSMEVINEVIDGEQKRYTGVGQEFTVSFKGFDDEGHLKYRIQVLRRFLINNRYNIETNLSKGQKIALQIAKLNDQLDFTVSKEFKLLKLNNVNEVQEKWAALKPSILKTYPDLKTIITDFDWQILSENIQRLYLEDNFYSFFFSGTFYHDFDENPVLETPHMLANALAGIDIPIKIRKKVAENDALRNASTVAIDAEINVAHKRYNPTRIQQFLDKIQAVKNKELELKFEYDGSYVKRPRQGLLIEGNLVYSMAFSDAYKKKTSINFKLENDE